MRPKAAYTHGMGRGKIINLRREAESGPGYCTQCATKGVADYIDTVAQRVKFHCPSCQMWWDEDIPQGEDETERVRVERMREAAAAARHHH